MKVKPVKEIEDFLRPIVEENGAELVEVVWNGRAKSLTVILDKEGGLDLVTCETVHRAIDAPLDELDPTFGEAYTLNCSSPGLDRPFRLPRDFEKNMGEKVEVRLYAPVDGKKRYEGVLCGYDGENVSIQTEGGEKSFPLKACSKICLLIEV